MAWDFWCKPVTKTLQDLVILKTSCHSAEDGGGAEVIKAHSFFRGVDWAHIRRYPAPFRPEFHNPEDTRHFDDDIPAEPLAPANGAPPDATRDPLLRD
ncbi:hypothetical protein DFH94DRAFT_690796 [Russula ochroleuca]|uniref:non-specific serine/threonine protein kinase n=1 Tax=Russula ochroleuca TaxID=152965 RepID=A0A9P5TAZ6_9AGAM|nr:hypothetical protein DFH94DRAFT_690796 [Russula ochroleuca]